MEKQEIIEKKINKKKALALVLIGALASNIDRISELSLFDDNNPNKDTEKTILNSANTQDSEIIKSENNKAIKVINVKYKGKDIKIELKKWDKYENGKNKVDVEYNGEYPSHEDIGLAILKNEKYFVRNQEIHPDNSLSQDEYYYVYENNEDAITGEGEKICREVSWAESEHFLITPRNFSNEQFNGECRIEYLELYNKKTKESTGFNYKNNKAYYYQNNNNSVLVEESKETQNLLKEIADTLTVYKK